MKKLFLISVVVCIALAACRGQKNVPNVPTAFPSITPKSSSTAIVTATPKFTNVPDNDQLNHHHSLRLDSSQISPTQLPPTPTFTPFPPYPNKQVVFDYYVTGNLADDDVFIAEESCCSITRLVLYDDGQLIIAGKSETYKQKVLSADQMKRFLSKVETLGFYSLESNQKHDQTDKLYDFGNNYQESFDGLQDCILVNADQSSNLCVCESYKQFLIPKMKNILKYLDEYEPASMTPYYPDRILLTIQAADLSVDNPPAIPWKEHFPSLDPSSNPGRYISDTSNQVVYIDGEVAKEIYLFFEGTDTKVVSQNGSAYILYIRVVLPHEKITNPYR